MGGSCFAYKPPGRRLNECCFRVVLARPSTGVGLQAEGLTARFRRLDPYLGPSPDADRDTPHALFSSPKGRNSTAVRRVRRMTRSPSGCREREDRRVLRVSRSTVTTPGYRPAGLRPEVLQARHTGNALTGVTACSLANTPISQPIPNSTVSTYVGSGPRSPGRGRRAAFLCPFGAGRSIPNPSTGFTARGYARAPFHPWLRSAAPTRGRNCGERDVQAACSTRSMPALLCDGTPHFRTGESV